MPMDKRLLQPDVIVAVALALITVVIFFVMGNNLLLNITFFALLLGVAFFAGRVYASTQDMPEDE